MNKKEILSYIRTFFLTLSFIAICTTIVTLVTENNTEKLPSAFEVKQYKKNQIDLLIEKYKYQEKLHPNNYSINLELGLIYENTAKLKEAENEYKKAIQKSPYGNFEAVFLLADLYTQKSQFDKALNLVDSIKEYPNPSLISSKAIFYSKIANKLYVKHMYAASIRQYLNSYYYQEKNSYNKTDVLKEIPKAYSALANEYVIQNKTAKAIRTLDEGIRLTKSPELMYQLGVTTMNINPEKSLDLFETVAQQDPTIIDYDKYNHLIMILVRKAENISDPILLRSYMQKLKLVERFAENNIIKPDDFRLKVIDAKYHEYPLKIRSTVEFDFVIRNNTSYDVSKLYAQIKIYNNDKLIKETEKRVATTANVIRRGRDSSNIHIKTSFFEKDDFIITKDVKVVISIKRNERLERTLLGEFLIPKTKR